jgi:hypothetical protein
MFSSRCKGAIGISVVVVGVILGALHHAPENFGPHEMGLPPHADDDHGSEPRTDSAQLTAPTMTSTPRTISKSTVEDQVPSGLPPFAILAALLIGGVGIYRHLSASDHAT